MLRPLLTVFLFPCCLLAQTQGNYSSSLQGSGGITEDGFGTMIGYNYYVDRNSFVQFSVFFALENDREGLEKVPHTTFAIQPSFFFTLVKTGNLRPMELRAGPGAVLGYETINNNEGELPSGAVLQAESGFIYGGLVGAEFEYHIDNRKWSLLVKANQHYHVNGALGNFQHYVALALKYYLF